MEAIARKEGAGDAVRFVQEGGDANPRAAIDWLSAAGGGATRVAAEAPDSGDPGKGSKPRDDFSEYGRADMEGTELRQVSSATTNRTVDGTKHSGDGPPRRIGFTKL
ncbi:MAG: hypothetical protein WBF81_08455 [Thermoplasmata archaeon]